VQVKQTPAAEPPTEAHQAPVEVEDTESARTAFEDAAGDDEDAEVFRTWQKRMPRYFGVSKRIQIPPSLS
jgi:hypothetical protein